MNAYVQASDSKRIRPVSLFEIIGFTAFLYFSGSVSYVGEYYLYGQIIMSRGHTLTQLSRYGIVGLTSNGALYLAYLGLTHAGLGVKLAMTSLYIAGVVLTFLFNKRWSFGHSRKYGPSFFRYCASYGIGYLVNLATLFILVDQLGLPHQIIQGIMIFCVAALLFLLQKFWVFRKTVFFSDQG